MLVWCLHNYRPVHVMAERRDDGFWYIPSLKKTIDGAELFRRPQGLIRYVLRLKASKHHDVPYLKLIQGGKVALKATLEEAVKLREEMNKVDKQYNQTRANFNKQLGKLLNSLENSLRGRQPQPEGETSEGEATPQE